MAELSVWTIPGYVIHERLDTSLVSATYLASRAADGYPVLLEVISEEFSDPASVEVYRATLAQVSTVRHPVVPSIWEFGQSDGLLYAITNAIEGRSLVSVLATDGPLPYDDALEVSTELADALDTLAAAGVVHGAVNPHTVWINDRSRSPSAPSVSLRGFGTMPLRAHAVRTQRAGPPPADLLYIAPEQVHGEEPTDLTDQYALACMTMHAMTGAAPFARPTVEALFAAHGAAEPGDEHVGADVLPTRVVGGLRRALANRPGDRFSSCIAFATAIGGTEQHSWDWHVDPSGEGMPAPPTERGDGAAVATGAAAPGTAQPQASAAGAAAAAAPDDIPAGVGRTGRARSPWLPIGVGIGAVVVLAGAVIAALSLLAGGDAGDLAGATTDQQIPQVESTWRTRVADGQVAALAVEDDEVLAVSQGALSGIDNETGEQRWQAPIDGDPRALSVLGQYAIVRTADGFTGIDRLDNTIAWQSSEQPLASFEAFITGRGRMFGVGPGPDGGLVVQAVDPATGDVAWSVQPGEGGAARQDPDPKIAFDAGESGGTLYVTWGDELHSFDVVARQPRWRTTVPGGAPMAITAAAGGILVLGGDGGVCRHDAADGSRTWTRCAALDRADAPASIVQVSGSHVIVASAREVLAVDTGSGTVQWRILASERWQPPMAGNASASFVVARDGQVEALDVADGATYWESVPIGEVGAMAATDEAVYLATANGQLTRLEAGSSDAG